MSPRIKRSPVAPPEKKVGEGLAATGGGNGSTTAETSVSVTSAPGLLPGGGGIEPDGVRADPVVYTETTPSGLVIEYEPSPRRLYRIRRGDAENINLAPGADNSAFEWREVPSVTTVLGVLDKPALSWWGMKVGVQGVVELLRREIIYQQGAGEGLADAADGEVDADDIVRFLTQEKLTVNHVVKEASDRGLSVHDAFETWARTGLKPFVLEYPEEEHPYLDALNRFLGDVNPEPLAAEIMVGSVQHGYAGRYDIRFRINDPVEAVVKSYPKREAKRAEIPAGTYLGDLKSSKSVYPASHFRQLAAYEAASIECGYEETDAQYVIQIGGDGQYQFVKSNADFEDFLAVLEVWQSNERLKAA